jgi:type I restriction enzyme, S subunit
MRPGYKQTEIGVIPESWDVIEIKSVVPAGKKYGIVDGPFGSNLKSIHYRKSGIPIITSGYVTEGRFLPKDYLFVDEEKFRQEKRSAVHGGDIVMAKIGARCGTSAILPPEQQTSILSGNAMKISVDQERHSTYYIWQVLWDMYLKGATDEIKTVGAQPAISMASLKKYRIAAPPKEEQEAIAAALSDADGLLAGLDRLIAKKRAVKTAVMQQLLTGEVRVGEGGNGRWETVRLGNVCQITTGKKDVNEGNPEGEFPFFTCSRSYTYSDSFSFDTEAILVAGNGEVGNLHYYSGKFEAYQRTYVLHSFSTNVQYLWYQLESNLVASLGIGTIGSSIPYIKMENLATFEFKQPVDVNGQNAIAAILSDIDAEIAALAARRAKTAAIKQGMMQELLTGRTRLA